MAYTSNNLLSLKDVTTGEITQFIPNSKIIIPAGEYINQNEARLIGSDGSVLIIKAGETVKDTKPQGREEIQKFNNQVKQANEKTVIRRRQVDKPVKQEEKTDLLDILNGN